jgi:hypothetical protein
VPKLATPVLLTLVTPRDTDPLRQPHSRGTRELQVGRKGSATVLLSLAESTRIGGRAAGRASAPTQCILVDASTTRVVLGNPVAPIARGVGIAALRANIWTVIRTLPLRRDHAAEDEQPSGGAGSRRLSYHVRHVVLLQTLRALKCDKRALSKQGRFLRRISSFHRSNAVAS